MPPDACSAPVSPRRKLLHRRTGPFTEPLPTPLSDRLNLFQRMMLRWRSLHPYNAVHVVRIPAPLDLPRLRASIAAQLEARALTGLWLDPKGRRCRFDGGPAQPQIELLGGENVPSPALAAAIEEELNRPFAASGPIDPFRFRVARTGSSFQLLLAYDHFIASGDSIAGLLTDIALCYLDGGARPARRPAARAGTTYRGLLLRHPLWALRAALGLPAMARRLRRTSRPADMSVHDASNGLVLVCVEPAQLRALIAAGKAWGVTVNDLLLAGLLLALAPLATARHLHARRTELAVASIVNMRKDFQTDAGGDALSPCLAAFHVGHAVPEGIGLRELAGDVHALTEPIRRKRLYLRSILALGLSALAWPVLRDKQRRGLFAKHFPASGGVSSLNLNPIWSERGAAASGGLDYFRVVPTGPLCPLVLAATTAHERTHIGIAYRKALFTPQAVARVAEDFLRRLDVAQPAR